MSVRIQFFSIILLVCPEEFIYPGLSRLEVGNTRFTRLRVALDSEMGAESPRSRPFQRFPAMLRVPVAVELSTSGATDHDGGKERRYGSVKGLMCRA
jgi:hypothetical protein